MAFVALSATPVIVGWIARQIGTEATMIAIVVAGSVGAVLIIGASRRGLTRHEPPSGR